ncbi:RNA polymerase-binding protein DksA [Aromatoleum bremense]|uniref:RNA polymerase-binding transcription factor DksA n=1 Tax=Aromatoleum bremense TaxID=76115 RepID=A0ABX1NPP5_9RHOO|nr:RNA polymerase-binding protein DksA [Aromatoleum bremense]NMG13954.1 RNA polymerase-binding protein DksA [Aromatoleum bremense]QTQ31870.1 RNA polymerase-binding transcription factor [Aromatoleum bremense]
MKNSSPRKRRLSEAELLGMSADDYMNDVQLEFFRERLLALQAELRENSEETRSHLRETIATPDEADRATQEEEQVLEQRIRDRELKLLHKVEAALRRIADGTYGYCEATGEPIGVGRLLARPTATLSLEEQERHERAERLFR